MLPPPTRRASPALWLSRRPALLALALPVLLAVACGARTRGTKRTGERCSSDLECARGFCVGGVAGPDPACTVSCGETEDCPRGWACSGVTENRLLVCSQGSPTPFGVGARE